VLIAGVVGVGRVSLEKLWNRGQAGSLDSGLDALALAEADEFFALGAAPAGAVAQGTDRFTGGGGKSVRHSARIFDPGDHARRLQLLEGPLNGRAGPIPFLDKISRSGAELPALQSGGLVVHPGRKDVRQVEPGLKARDLFPVLTKQRVRPGLSPEECVIAVHLLLQEP